MIDNEAMVDAIDGVKATVTPDVISWLERMAKAARVHKQSAEEIAGYDALLVLARELAK